MAMSRAPQDSVVPKKATSAGARGAADLLIRPISPDDKQALVDGFERLGAESRYRRFLSPHNRLSQAELRYLTEVDHSDHEALVAIDPNTHQGAGIARYVRSRRDPTAAELAIAVVDDWQRMGVGTRLAAALTDRARQEGITTFTALVLANNEPMLNLARQLGPVRVTQQQQGTIGLAIELPEQGAGHLSRLLQAVATGDLTPFAARYSTD